MQQLLDFLDIFLHLDKHLGEIINQYGITTYLILALIVFCETGLVVTPFLPGDSLLFAAGALTAGSELNIIVLIAILLVAAILGDAVNYQIGKMLGAKVLNRPDTWYFKKSYIEKTEKFYAKYGGKTIIIARFVPIVRTFAPFLAGIGVMSYSRFVIYNVIGAVLWVCSLTLAGFYFGGLPIVKNNFGLVVLGIIIVSILPAAFEFLAVRKESKKQIKNSSFII